MPVAKRSKISEDFSGARLFVSDTRIAFLLLNEARYRAMARLFGLPRDQANLATVILALVLAETVHERTQRMLSAPAPPAGADVLLGAASLRELLRSLAGPNSRDTPLLGTLLMLAVLGGPARRAAIRSAQGIRASSNRTYAGFRHRYGYLVDPGHLRQRRADRRSARRAPPTLANTP